VIVTGGMPLTLAAKSATSTIPIVFIIGTDPVDLGFVSSLARPGGNLTGMVFMSSELMPKRLELLSELVPQAKVIALLVNPNNGDVIVCPAGGAEKAHQLINTSASELRYLSISSMDLPEVAEYPDSTKFGVYSVTAAETAPPQRRLVFLGRTASGVDYFDGEG
jgi:hypothetical protein